MLAREHVGDRTVEDDRDDVQPTEVAHLRQPERARRVGGHGTVDRSFVARPLDDLVHSERIALADAFRNRGDRTGLRLGPLLADDPEPV